MDGHDDGTRSLPLDTAGSLIRAARERRGLTLEVLFQETRIPVHVLEAIEQDDFDRIQPALYARSFLRTVAEALDLDPARLIALYEQGRRDAAPASAPTWRQETRVERVHLLGNAWRRRLLWLVPALLLLAVVGIWLGRRGAERPAAPAAGDTVATHAAPAPPVPEAAASAPETAVTVSDSSRTASTPPPAATVAAPAVLDTLHLERLLAPPDTAALRAAARLPAGTPALEFAGGRRYRWVLRLLMDRRVPVAVAVTPTSAPEPADWSRIDTPGVPHAGIVPGRVYAAGSRFVAYWGAEDCFVVRLGAADGVTLTLNGEPRPVPRRNVGRDWMLCAPGPAAGR